MVLFKLISGGSPRLRVRALIVDLHSDDHLASRIGDQVYVVRRPEAAVRHLHHPCFRIGGGHTRFVFFLAIVGLLASLGLGHLLESTLDALGPAGGGTLARAFFPTTGRARISIELGGQRFHLLASNLAKFLESVAGA